jgi:hypothetical protein
MAIRGNLAGVNRAVALVLAVVWLGAGAAAIAFGLSHGLMVVVIVAAAAIVYGLLWLRVAARSRLLTWRELVAPWRA